MRSPSPNFTEQKNAATNRPIWLFDIHWGDGAASGVLRIAQYSGDVSFDGETYRSDIPIQHTGLPEESGSRQPGANLMLGNANRTVETLLVSCDGLAGQKIVVTKVFADALFPEDSISWEYEIDRANSNATQVTLNLVSRAGFMDLDVPARLFSSDLFSSVPSVTEVIV